MPRTMHSAAQWRFLQLPLLNFCAPVNSAVCAGLAEINFKSV